MANSKRSFGIGSIIGLGIVGLVIVVIMFGLSLRGQAITLRNQYKAKEKTVQTAHDNMWKTIQQKFEVGDEYKSGFIASIAAAAEGRKGGTLFKSVQENMPGLAPDLYREIMATIEGKRDMLKREMDTEVDVARQFNTLIEKWNIFPFGMFLGDTTLIDAKIITSGRTSNAWESGQDDEVSLREKPKAIKFPVRAPSTQQ